MKPFYRVILRNAWLILRRYKFLWFFGFFAALTSNGEEYDILVRNVNTATNIENQVTSLRKFIQDGTLGTAWDSLKNYFTSHVFSSILAIFVSLVVILIIIWLITISQTAIIYTASLHREKKQNGFLDAFIVGNKYFLPIFLLNIIAKIIIYGGLLIFGIPLTIGYVNTGNITWLSVLSIFVLLILILFNMIISFITKYASSYVILKGKRVWDAFRNGWKLFFKNWLISLEMALILFVINFCISFVIIALLAFAGVPFTLVGIYVFYAIILFMGALLATFQFSSWTYLFLDLNENIGISKLVRIFRPKQIKQ